MITTAHCLIVAQEIYLTKKLFTNATVAHDAIRFVSQKSKVRIKSSISEDDKEPKEPDSDEEKDQLEEEQEEQTGEITINHLF